MPELPEVETVRRGLAPHILGRRFARVEQRRKDLRFPFPQNFASRLEGRRLTALTRRAKYLIGELDDGEALVMHLGMSGSFRVEKETPGRFHHARNGAPAHDHVVFHFEPGVSVTYNDPRRFGFMLLEPRATLEAHRLFDGLGLEPLGDDFTGAALLRLFSGRRAPLKAALLDQRLVAGLGNIYVCEALHRSRLSPLRAAGDIGRADASRLAKAVRAVLEEAIAAGGSSLRDHRQTDGSLGYFQHSFAAYDKEGAACANPRCRGAIERVIQSGRSTFYCASCQK